MTPARLAAIRDRDAADRAWLVGRDIPPMIEQGLADRLALLVERDRLAPVLSAARTWREGKHVETAGWGLLDALIAYEAATIEDETP